MNEEKKLRTNEWLIIYIKKKKININKKNHEK